MFRTLAGSLALLVLVPALWADDKPKDEKPTPAEQYKALMSEFQKLNQDIGKNYNEAKTAEEKGKILQDFRNKVGELADKFLDLAEKNPKEKVSFDAISFVVSRVQPGPKVDRALELALKQHADKLATLAPRLIHAQSPMAEKLLRTAVEKSVDAKDKAQAAFSLAQYLMNEAESSTAKEDKIEGLTKEAEALFATVVEKYSEEGGRFVEMAKGALFEIRNLGIGKTAPEVEGEDIDGKKFKLSDYRGKVVVLDFWGNW